MNRTLGLILALAATTTAGACASSGGGQATAQPTPAAATETPAQPGKQYPPGIAKPSDTDETRKATIMLVKAQAQKDSAAAAQQYQQALQTVKEGLQKDSLNPKLWLTLGQAAAGLSQYELADSAFSRAQEIYPAYEPDVESERESAWIAAFNAGVKALQAGNKEEAQTQLERAQMVYDKRPEALMNLASIYVGQDQPEKAAAAYARVLEIVNDTARASLPAEVTADWDRYGRMARSNTAQLYAQAGVDAFRAEKYDEAAGDFQKALDINPFYRDALYNLAQALYLQTNQLEEQRDSAAAAEKQQIEGELQGLYKKFVDVSEKVREIDPYNGNALLLLARGYRGLGLIATTPAEKKEWQDKALAALQDQQAMKFQVTNMQVATQDSAMQLQGTLENASLDQGTPVTLKFTMLDEGGADVGSNTVTVNAPAKTESTSFQLTVPVSRDVLGWKYERVQQ